MAKRLNDTEALRGGLRHPGSTLYGTEVREDRVSDEALPTYPTLLFGLGPRPQSAASPNRGAACLYRDRRFSAAGAGDRRQSLRSAVMYLGQGAPRRGK